MVSDGDADFAAEETRSRFTEYSMTSSAMHRNDKLQLLDERFERVSFFVVAYMCEALGGEGFLE